MEVPIYVDVLFVINLFINYFLLLLSARFAHVKIKRWRILLGAVFGGLYACVIFFCDFPTPIIFLTKVVTALLIVYIAFAPKTQRDVIRIGLIFLISNLILGGVCYAVYFFFAPLNMTFRNTVVYFNLSPIVLILVTIVTYLIVVFFDSFLKPRYLEEGKDYLVEIHYHGRTCTLNGFIDTGNQLTDFFTNTPVVVCSYSAIQNLLDPQEKYVFENFLKIDDLSKYIEKIRLIPVNTVSSGAFLPAFSPDEFILKSESKTHFVANILIAVSTESALKNEPIILNPQLICE